MEHATPLMWDFKKGIFSADVFASSGYLINSQHCVRVRYFDRTLKFGMAIHTDGWFDHCAVLCLGASALR